MKILLSGDKRTFGHSASEGEFMGRGWELNSLTLKLDGMIIINFSWESFREGQNQG
jgi:hypothetical protein